jgi:putative endonuclease
MSVIPWPSVEVTGATGFFFICWVYGWRPTQASHPNIFTFDVYRCALERAPRGLRDSSADATSQKQNEETERGEKFQRKEKARRRGLLGETYDYWYLRRQGYVFIAKNYMSQGAKGEPDLVGYDGETIAFVEIRTRTVREDISGRPELSVNNAKPSVLVRTAQRFLTDRHLNDCPRRFDVLAIDNIRGRPPEIRLHKDAFSPQLRHSR